MTEKELLELLVKKFDNLEKEVHEIKQDNKAIHAKLDNLENKVDNLENKVDNLENKVDNLENKVNNLENKVNNLENKVNNLENKVDNLENKVNNLENKVDNLENKVDNLENKVNNLEKEVKQNTSILETTVEKCIKVIGEGYQANFEKIDRLNLDSMKSKITQLELMQQFTTKEIERIKLKIS